MEKIEIETRLLGQDKDTVQEEIQSLKSQTEKLKEQVETLGGMWEGPAKDAFMNQFAEDCEFIESFFAEMDAYVQAMEYAEMEYNKCENEAARIVEAIEI